jgi:hypothetical protein
MCAFSGYPGSVLGARYPALGVDPGTGSQVPGARDAVGQSGNKAECLAHASKNAPTGYASWILHPLSINRPGPGI